MCTSLSVRKLLALTQIAAASVVASVVLTTNKCREAERILKSATNGRRQFEPPTFNLPSVTSFVADITPSDICFIWSPAFVN